MHRILRTLLVFVLLAAAGFAADDFAETKKKAEAGDANAQYTLSLMYANGTGVPQDDVEALKWLRKADDQRVNVRAARAQAAREQEADRARAAREQEADRARAAREQEADRARAARVQEAIYIKQAAIYILLAIPVFVFLTIFIILKFYPELFNYFYPGLTEKLSKLENAYALRYPNLPKP